MWTCSVWQQARLDAFKSLSVFAVVCREAAPVRRKASALRHPANHSPCVWSHPSVQARQSLTAHGEPLTIYISHPLAHTNTLPQICWHLLYCTDACEHKDRCSVLQLCLIWSATVIIFFFWPYVLFTIIQRVYNISINVTSLKRESRFYCISTGSGASFHLQQWRSSFICLQTRTHVRIKHLAVETMQSLGTVAAVDIFTVSFHCTGPLPCMSLFQSFLIVGFMLSHSFQD